MGGLGKYRSLVFLFIVCLLGCSLPPTLSECGVHKVKMKRLELLEIAKDQASQTMALTFYNTRTKEVAIYVFSLLDGKYCFLLVYDHPYVDPPRVYLVQKPKGVPETKSFGGNSFRGG